MTHHERAVRVLEGGMGGEDRVVRLNDGVRQRGGWVYAELQLALLAIVSGKTLQDQSAKPRASSSTKRVEHKETLQPGTVVGQTADLVHHVVDLFLANSVMTTGIWV